MISIKDNNKEKVWLYYVSIFLSRTNTKFTMYKGKRRRLHLISTIFIIPDEACTVTMMINYLEQSKMTTAEPDKKNDKINEFDAKFTSSKKGTRVNFWSDEGKVTFNK